MIGRTVTLRLRQRRFCRLISERLAFLPGVEDRGNANVYIYLRSLRPLSRIPSEDPR